MLSSIVSLDNESVIGGEENDRPEFAVEPKLFGKWSYEGVQSPDHSLSNYLQVKPVRQQVFVPYTAGPTSSVGLRRLSALSWSASSA